jgi:hypothetical protein
MLLMMVKLLLLLLAAIIAECMQLQLLKCLGEFGRFARKHGLRYKVYGDTFLGVFRLQTQDKEHIMSHENHCHDSKFYLRICQYSTSSVRCLQHWRNASFVGDAMKNLVFVVKLTSLHKMKRNSSRRC